jgi:hypothetical protein
VRGAGLVFGDAGDDSITSHYGPGVLDGGDGNDLSVAPWTATTAATR